MISVESQELNQCNGLDSTSFQMKVGKDWTVLLLWTLVRASFSKCWSLIGQPIKLIWSYRGVSLIFKSNWLSNHIKAVNQYCFNFIQHVLYGKSHMIIMIYSRWWRLSERWLNISMVVIHLSVYCLVFLLSPKFNAYCRHIGHLDIGN